MSSGAGRELTTLVRYAPAICTKCGSVFRSDLPIAKPPWITPAYRASGGMCPRCGQTGLIPAWVFRFNATAELCRSEASDQQRRDLLADLEHYLRRHRTAKQTQAFVGDFRGPWKPLLLVIKQAPQQQRRAQLSFLSWILAEDT
ncbi:MAG: hypothetical protein ABWZ02_08580 [Nakamurella sp.]